MHSLIEMAGLKHVLIAAGFEHIYTRVICY